MRVLNIKSMLHYLLCYIMDALFRGGFTLVSLHSVMSAVHIRPWKTLRHSDDVKSCHTKNTLVTNKDPKFNPFTLCTLFCTQTFKQHADAL